MLVFALPVLMQRYVQQQYVTQTNASVLELRRMNSELSLANHEVVEANHSIHELNSRLRTVNTELFRTVGQILDARDPYVAGHSAQVAHYAAAIATELGMSSERVELVYHAGLLHDLGKIALPEHILNKPSKLTLLEFEQMKRHPEIGAELLSSSPALHHIAPLIRHHHERWDGHGYPDQLAGEAIPLESRILAVCDTVEAMASDRPYRRAEPLAAIIAELRRCSGTQFEPQVVEAFIRLVEQSVDGFVVNSARAVQQRTGREMPAIAAERDFRREVASSWMLNKLQT
jgi:putative nucleotidyltransferase with HDIG domain